MQRASEVSNASKACRTWRRLSRRSVGQLCLATAGLLVSRGTAAAASAGDDSLLVSDASVSPDPFVPDGSSPSGVLTLQFTIWRPGVVTIQIASAVGGAVRTLAGSWPILEAGRHAILWDGIDSQGQPAPSGAYVYRIEATDKVGSSASVVTGSFALECVCG